jgi:hypothetical protein
MKMKKIDRLVFGMAVALIILNGCGNIGNKEAEYDGGYILAADDSFISLKEVTFYSTQIAKARMSRYAMFHLPNLYYTLDPIPSATQSANNIQGIFIKGNYNFENFSLHPLQKKQLLKGERLFENKGSATGDKPFFIVGEEIKIKKKKTENGYSFIPEDKLSKGKYVGWIESSFWVFEAN